MTALRSPSSTRTNARICFVGAHELSIEREELEGAVEADQVLLRCVYSLISPGTELSIYTGAHRGFEDPTNWAKYPFYPGYAAVGEVELVGSAVEGFAAGDLVYYPGRHQRYAVVSPSAMPVLPLPADLPPELAPFARFGQISNTAVAVSAVAAGDPVAILGLGLVGNMAAQLFGLRGAAVVGVDLIGFRRELAKRVGVPRAIDAENRDAVAAVLAATAGVGARTVVEATGLPALVGSAVRMARPRGEVILLGSPLTAAGGSGSLDVSALDLIHKGVVLKGAHETLIPRLPAGPGGPSQRAVAEQMLRLLQERRLVVEPLISGIVGPNEIARAYAALLAEKDKTMAVLIDWTKE